MKLKLLTLGLIISGFTFLASCDDDENVGFVGEEFYVTTDAFELKTRSYLHNQDYITNKHMYNTSSTGFGCSNNDAGYFIHSLEEVSISEFPNDQQQRAVNIYFLTILPKDEIDETNDNFIAEGLSVKEFRYDNVLSTTMDYEQIDKNLVHITYNDEHGNYWSSSYDEQPETSLFTISKSEEKPFEGSIGDESKIYGYTHILEGTFSTTLFPAQGNQQFEEKIVTGGFKLPFRSTTNLQYLKTYCD